MQNNSLNFKNVALVVLSYVGSVVLGLVSTYGSFVVSSFFPWILNIDYNFFGYFGPVLMYILTLSVLPLLLGIVLFKIIKNRSKIFATIVLLGVVSGVALYFLMVWIVLRSLIGPVAL